MSDDVAPAGDAGIKRACDHCRSRKIKCDKSIPCANCVVANRTCVATGFGQKCAGTRQRVLISTQYEQKVDQIASRLGDIERLLQDVVSSIRRQDHSGVSHIPLHQESASSKLPPQKEESGPMFEGGSSLTAHTNLVSSLVSRTVKQINLPSVSPDIQTALLALQNIIERQYQKANGNDVGFPNQQPLPPGGVRQLQMPPPQLVLRILQNLKENGPAIPFALHCIFLRVEDFIEYCRKVYSVIDDFDISTFIVVNGGIFYALGQKTLVQEHINNPDERADFSRYRKLCADNMSAALGSLSLFVPTSKVSIQALLMGTNYAIEASRPSLAWKMSNLAAQMCLTLGYHRMPPTSEANGERTNDPGRADTFSYTYMLNKALSLRLGRVSALHDFDISVPIYPKRKLGDSLWRTIIAFRVRHAQVQGKIYDQLYSSEALQASPEQRVQSAMTLAQQVKAMIQDSQNFVLEVGRVMDSNKASFSSHNGWELMLKSDMVSFHSTLTLIYRAIPQSSHASTTFAYECNQASLAAIQYHRECMQYSSPSPVAQAGYIHWTLLFAPFTPLIVIFCAAIETLDEDYLRLLENFAVSFDSVSTQSEAIEQFYRLAQALHNIARLYIKAKMSSGATHDAPPLEPDFEAYLCRLGLMTTGVEHGATGSTVSTPTTQGGAQIGGWFAGNLTMMGLLEEDLAHVLP